LLKTITFRTSQSWLILLTDSISI